MALLPTPPYFDGQEHVNDAGVTLRYVGATNKWIIVSVPSGNIGMSADTYDPQTIAADAFDRGNHTG